MRTSDEDKALLLQLDEEDRYWREREEEEEERRRLEESEEEEQTREGEPYEEFLKTERIRKQRDDDESTPLDVLMEQENARMAALGDDEEFVNEFQKSYTVNGIEGCRLLDYSDDVPTYEDKDGNAVIPEGAEVHFIDDED